MSGFFNQWLMPDGTVWAKFYRTENGYLIHFSGLADFTISSDGQDIDARPARGVSSQTVEHLYLNQVMPLALSRQFKLVLHGSAIEVDGSAIAVLGASGRGKSTLAASFATNGYRFLTDDGLQLECINGTYLAQPNHPSIRLWNDSRVALIPADTPAAPSVDYTPKARLLPGGEMFCNHQRSLRAIYFLGEGGAESVSIEPLGGKDAIMEMVRHSFLLDINERDVLVHHFGQLSGLAKSGNFFRLDYPRQYDYLPEVRAAIVSHALTLRV